jgi:hypothetical protein
MGCWREYSRQERANGKAGLEAEKILEFFENRMVWEAGPL